ncbi:hypothetical protein ABIE53_000529 [Burkholderia sp. OAS925]
MRQHGNVPTERHQDLAQVGDIGLKKSAMCEWEGSDLTGRIAVEISTGETGGENTEPNPRPLTEPDSNAWALRAWIRRLVHFDCLLSYKQYRIMSSI